MKMNTLSSSSMSDDQIVQKCGHTRIAEDVNLQTKLRKICVLWNHVPEHVTLEAKQNVIAFKFVTTVDGSLRRAKQEMVDGKLLLHCLMFGSCRVIE